MAAYISSCRDPSAADLQAIQQLTPNRDPQVIQVTRRHADQPGMQELAKTLSSKN